MKQILVIQFRDDVSEAHEQACYSAMLPAHRERIIYRNALRDDLARIPTEDIGAIILGGSGQFYVSNGDGEGAWREHTYAFIDRALAQDIPLLGVCFGFQLLAAHQGARVIRDRAMSQVGSFQTTILPAAINDSLCINLPERFFAQFGHKDTAVDFPDHLIPLAQTERVACAAFHIADKHAWGALFHIELDRERMGERLRLFPHYAEDQNKIEETLSLFQDTPEAASILTRFVDTALSTSAFDTEMSALYTHSI